VSHWGPGAPRHITSAANWREPIKWAKAARWAGRRDKVFCASQADIFELEAPAAARQDLWRLIGDTCDALDWQLLTKRPQNILSVMCDDNLNLGFFELTRCWLGTSVENQQAADQRIPELLAIDAAMRFLSCEPLLEMVQLEPLGLCKDWRDGTSDEVNGIDWVICGGESGPGARPMHPDWARSLRDECAVAGVPFFFKQWGEYGWWNQLPDDTAQRLDAAGEGHSEGNYRVGKKAAGSLLDGVEHKAFPVVRP
jgi:protein gp37